MQINRPLLDTLAHLARLELTEEEAGQMVVDLNLILEWVDKLQEVDTEQIEPLISMSHEINSMREDEVGKHLDPSKVFEHAPSSDGEFFMVPKVLD